METLIASLIEFKVTRSGIGLSRISLLTLLVKSRIIKTIKSKKKALLKKLYSLSRKLNLLKLSKPGLKSNI